MKERSPVKKNILKLIPYIEIIAGVIFLCLEIHDYRTLYSIVLPWIWLTTISIN